MTFSVVISNVFEDSNRGGAAITAQTIMALKETGAEVAAVSVLPFDYPQRSHPVTVATFPEVPILPPILEVDPGRATGIRAVALSLRLLARPRAASVPEAAAAIRSSRLVVSKGGHVFVERPRLASVLTLWTTTFPIVFAQRVGVPTMTGPTSVGPFTSRSSRWLNRAILRRMSLIVTRDPLSTQAALELGIPASRVVELTDVVLGMNPPSTEAVDEITARIGLLPSTYVTMTVRLARSGSLRMALLDSLVNSARTALEHPKVSKVVLVDQAGDAADTAAVAERIGDGAVTAPWGLSPVDLVALYGGSRATVACRLHSAIFSLVAGTPALVVSLDGAKTEGVYASVGLPSDWVFTADQQALARLPYRLGEVLSSGEWSRERIRAQVDEVAGQLSRLPELMSQLVLRYESAY